MDYIKRFDSFLINELFIHNEDNELEGKYFILYKKNLWVFSEEEWEDNELWEEISNKLGEPEYFLGYNVHDAMLMLQSEHAYILSGEIRNGYIQIGGRGYYRHSSSSEDLAKLKKELKLPINVNYQYYDEIRNYELRELEKLKTAYYYHGTSMKYLDQINRTGIRPMGGNTNFNQIKHNDKIFFTSNIEKAHYHAYIAALKTNSFPIILKFKIPDPSKVVIDFDVAIDFYGTDDNDNMNLGYSNIITDRYEQGIKGKLISDSEKVNIMNKLGIFGYKGRIPSSRIDKVIIDINALNKHSDVLSMGDILYEDDDLWKTLSNVSDWQQWSIDSVLSHRDKLLDKL